MYPNCSPNFANLGSTWTPCQVGKVWGTIGVHMDPTRQSVGNNWDPRGPQVGKVRGTIGVVHVDPRLAKFGEQLGYNGTPVCQWTF